MLNVDDFNLLCAHTHTHTNAHTHFYTQRCCSIDPGDRCIKWAGELSNFKRLERMRRKNNIKGNLKEPGDHIFMI